MIFIRHIVLRYAETIALGIVTASLLMLAGCSKNKEPDIQAESAAEPARESKRVTKVRKVAAPTAQRVKVERIPSTPVPVEKVSTTQTKLLDTVSTAASHGAVADQGGIPPTPAPLENFQKLNAQLTDDVLILAIQKRNPEQIDAIRNQITSLEMGMRGSQPLNDAQAAALDDGLDELVKILDEPVAPDQAPAQAKRLKDRLKAIQDKIDGLKR